MSVTSTSDSRFPAPEENNKTASRSPSCHPSDHEQYLPSLHPGRHLPPTACPYPGRSRPHAHSPSGDLALNLQSAQRWRISARALITPCTLYMRMHFLSAACTHPPSPPPAFQSSAAAACIIPHALRRYDGVACSTHSTDSGPLHAYMWVVVIVWTSVAVSVLPEWI